MSTVVAPATSLRRQLIGNTFLHPVVDYLLIGSLWSIVVTLYWLVEPSVFAAVDSNVWVWCVLLATSAHFAAATVRLYSKPAYYREFSFLSFAFPLITLAVLVVLVIFPGTAGRHFQVLYLTWAPFHYAKQIYGLSLMYSFRSGLKLLDGDKKLIYWVSMVPFLYALFSGSSHMGVGWLLSPELVQSTPWLLATLTAIKKLLLLAVFIAPAFLYWKIWSSKRRILPLMVLMLMLSNGLWWTALNFNEAFVLATIGHGVQYLAIILIYHVREQLAEPGNKHGWFFHATSFYARCVLLAYALFSCLPFVFVWFGAGVVESMLMVIAIINVHHFIVDAYIWRLRVPVNREVLMDAAPATQNVRN